MYSKMQIFLYLITLNRFKHYPNKNSFTFLDGSINVFTDTLCLHYLTKKFNKNKQVNVE